MKISEEEIEWMHNRQTREKANFLFILEGIQVKGEIQAWRIDDENNFVLIKNSNDEFWFIDIDRVVAIQELYHADLKKKSITRE